MIFCYVILISVLISSFILLAFMELCSCRKRLIQRKIFIFFFYVILFIFAAYNTLNSKILMEIKFSLAAKADFAFQKFKKTLERMSFKEGLTLNKKNSRRMLEGPGSSAPRCMSKCGRCTPCRPVHVPVPPGTPVTAEYYPEAWRCKCDNKLYMP